MHRHSWLFVIALIAVFVATPACAGEKAPKPGEVREFEIAAGVTMRFCWIPAGEIQLGAPAAEQWYVINRFYADVRPGWMSAECEEQCAKFNCKGLWLGQSCVTQKQWQAVMESNPSWFSKTGEGRSLVVGLDTDRLPAEQVSWNDCRKFIASLNGRDGLAKAFGEKGTFALPHENEWEYACRGGRGNATPFYFGKELDGRQANCEARRSPVYHPRFPISEKYIKAIERLGSPLNLGSKPDIDVAVGAWMGSFEDHLKGTEFHLRVNRESLAKGEPVALFGEASPRLRMIVKPGTTCHEMMEAVLKQLELTFRVNEDHIEILRQADANRYDDRAPIYEPNSAPSEQYKKAVAILNAKMNPSLDHGLDAPLSMWLDLFRGLLKESAFEIRINEKSLQREPTMKITDEGLRARTQALPDATAETVISKALWDIGLTWIIHPDHIEILKIADAKRKPVETEAAGVAVGRTTEVGLYAADFPHPWGLCDMHGNVWQWCENWFDQEHTMRVLRGGSWNTSPADCRAARRIGANSERHANDCGFRVCFRPD